MSIRMIVTWAATDDAEFARRYQHEHLPLAQALPGLVSAQASPLRSRTSSILAEFTFPDLDTMKSAFASDAGVALLAHTADLESAFGVTSNSLVALEPFG